MSTFDGRVAEFPSIRIDRFRASQDDASPPLVYFLSHVHADHLVGLESCRRVFVYCSPATREILLRLEKYPHRMNFAQGILEVRKQTYRRLTTLIKAIPLETPTDLELSPGNSIRVTLFNANHCVGAVMFLIQGSSKTILYSGDVRSEGWWVDSLIRNPVIVPYIGTGNRKPLKALDNLYLDTSYVASGAESIYRQFPSKQEGLIELLEKVSRYPDTTVFYLDAWTFGYEEVWEALANHLNVRIHLDDYRYKLYAALADGPDPKPQESHVMCGHVCGNHVHKGILTREPTRLHSCEKGAGCDVFSREFVRITPVVSRYKGQEVAELGIGGGLGDLDQYLELDLNTPGVLYQLIGYCVAQAQTRPELGAVVDMLRRRLDDPCCAMRLNNTSLAQTEIRLEQPHENKDRALTTDQISLEQLISALLEVSRSGNIAAPIHNEAQKPEVLRADGLPSRITFPYARHSSYSELCHFVKAFRPRQITPCTVMKEDWHQGRSMSRLFGHLYKDGHIFLHDALMEENLRLDDGQESQSPIRRGFPARFTDHPIKPQNSSTQKRKRSPDEPLTHNADGRDIADQRDGGGATDRCLERTVIEPPSAFRDMPIASDAAAGAVGGIFPTTNYEKRMRHALQVEAHDAALGVNGRDWSTITLVSTRMRTFNREDEL